VRFSGRVDLDRMRQTELCELYRRMGYIDGAHPPETWTKTEVVSAILRMVDQSPHGCARCTDPRVEFCGYGGTGRYSRPCVGCGEETHIRAYCGAARTATCSVTPPAAAPAPERVRAPRAPRAERINGRRAAQEALTAATLAGLAVGEPLRLLDALTGPFAPLRSYAPGKMSRPFWRAPLPGVTFGGVHVVSGYTWTRPYVGRVAVLDRTGAWVGATSSVEVIHGRIEHTGACEWAGHPGDYLLTAYPWTETDMPHPLGHVTPGDQVWVPAPTVKLLADLVEQGRWPDVTIDDSYTGDPCRLTDWAGHIRDVRAHIIRTYGRDSEQYDPQFKQAFGQAMSLMLGKIGSDGVTRVWACDTARADHYQHVVAQGSATHWRWADDCRRVAPELPPVALRNIDELVVPYDAVEILTTTTRPGGRRPLVIDPEGIALGTFKIKDVEIWEEH
jgi:hypothetical protein